MASDGFASAWLIMWLHVLMKSSGRVDDEDDAVDESAASVEEDDSETDDKDVEGAIVGNAAPSTRRSAVPFSSSSS